MTLAAPPALSRRQLEVLRCYLRTGSRQQAARCLGISPHTVRGHLAALYRELGVSSALEAARALGWLDVPVG